MPVTRGIEDLERLLIHHQHDHPPVRDLNREADRRATLGQQAAQILTRAVGSWPFLIAQAGLMVLWLVLNGVAIGGHWSSTSLLVANLVFGFETVVVVVIALMAFNRSAHRDRLRAQADYEMHVKLEEELKMLMSHLEVQDEILIEVLQRLDQQSRQLRLVARRMGLEERVG
jgi:uncharacterized membrane protein